jgi:hypothetical protein
MPKRFEMNALRVFPACFIAATCLLSAPPLSALTLDGPEAAIGQWDIALAPGAKTCRLTLRGERVHGGFFVGVPPACRHAMPVLATVAAWSLPGDNRLDLADVYGKPLLDFAVEKEDRFTAAGPQGETYRLALIERVPAARSNPAAATPAAAVAAPPRAVPRPGDVPGRYAVLREASRDTGCMVTLDAGGNRAFLAPACRDQGIVIFDPRSWRLVGGRLELTARKGHTTALDLQPDGTWLKDAKDGKSLALKKL